jgi:murein DD-endopeptidase MepM/ murein hydrolase activator NlpD
MARYPDLDPWSPDPATRDKATIAWIGLIGQEQGVDILGAIQSGDFATADRALGPDQFSSLPGGSQASQIWNNPANLQTYGPATSGGNAPSTGTATAGSGVNCGGGSGGSSPGGYTGPTSGAYRAPVNGTITSGFGHRESPGGVGSTNHKGIDYGVPIGTHVNAAANGKVIYSGWIDGYGNTVIIDHGGGNMTLYAHLSEIRKPAGAIVRAGEQVAWSGNSGNSTGPHLHFETIVGGNGSYLSGSSVDPLTMLRR